MSMEIDESFHELRAAVKMYYEIKRNDISKDQDVQLYYIYQAKETELYEFLEAIKEFLEWGATV